MIGMMVIDIKVSKYALIIIPASIIILILSRATGVFISSVLTKNNIPGNYSMAEFVALMTWAALKGGLSLALAIETAEYLPPDVYGIFLNVAYVAIFFTVLVQGLSIRRVYFALEDHKSERHRRNKIGRAHV